MNLEAQYQQALELTHQMLVCAKTQDWERLSHLGQQRATLVEQAATHRVILALAEEKRIAALINEIERESAEILERAESWQKHARVLLRMDKAPVT